MRRFLPSLSALQAFDSAARHLSFTRAAEDLMLTQSGISRQIHNLEAMLGARLFERTGSRLVLTDAGRSYAQEVRETLDHLEEISIDVVRGRKANTALMLGAPATFASRWLVPRLARFSRANAAVPTEIVHLQPGTLADQDTLDIAILRGVEAWRETRASPLFRERLSVVGSPDLVQDLGPMPSVLDFRKLPTLQNSNRPSLWLSWLRSSGQPYEGAIQGTRLPQNEMLIRAAVAGLGLAVVPTHYVTDELADGRLVAPFGAPVSSGESYWVAIPEARAHKPHLLAVRDWLLQEARTEPTDRGWQIDNSKPHDKKS